MKLNLLLKRSAIASMLLAASGSSYADVDFNLDAGMRGTRIGDLHYGIFFEEINHAGDGGLYAELVKNRSFEDASSPQGWSKTGNSTWKLISSGLLNENQGKALEVTFSQAGEAILNSGFWGINAISGDKYSISFWIKSDKGFDGNLKVSLVDNENQSIGKTEIPVKATGTWQKVTSELMATENYPKAQLRIETDKPGTLCFDVVSLFPPTYKDRPNGCRRDLAAMLEAMKPSFVRFPGGCFIEGTYQNGAQNRFEWKKTIGPIETRPGHLNVNWNYRVSDGLGFHELLQLTEDLGAEPLYVVNIGLGHGWSQPYTDLDDYIKEALDAIEYCNGDISTEWGARRAANGHPEPFNLRLIEVGNENYQANANEQSDHYAERYRAFYDAIKAEWPDMLIIGNVEAWGTDNPSWRNNHPVDAVDEHYYRNPEWFGSNYSKYDFYDRKGPKVYAGEYAVTSDFGNTGSLRAALGEAIYMLGMERNSDICVMNSYAPIFVNENDQRWMPDMIRFNSSYCYGTPSYYVQQLFPNNTGKENIIWTETGNKVSTGHKIAFSTWNTSAEFDNIKITDFNNSELLSEDFASKPSGWTLPSGWNADGGCLSQTSESSQGSLAICDSELPDNFIFEFDAVKKSGAEGFLVAFNFGSEKDYIWWNIAGWNNTQHALEVCTNGAKTQYDIRAGKIETGKTYHGRIVVDGNHIVCYLDNELIHDITLPVARKLYISSNIDDETGMLYCKVVNMTSSAETANISINNASLLSAESIVMTADNSEAENTSDNRTNVAPKTGEVTVSDGVASFEAPAYSLTILKFQLSDILRKEGKPLSEAELAVVKNSLSSLQNRLAHLRSYATLPTTTSDGYTIKWELPSDASSDISLIKNNWSARINVVSSEKGNKPVKAGKLIAYVSSPDGNTGTIEFPITLAPSDNRYGYLYCYMNSEKEITNYALGTKEDKGRKFSQLLNGAEIFDTKVLAGIEKGTRDAYLDRGQNDNEYFMVTTDMCNATSKVWFNYGIDLLRSSDLIHWESSVFDFRKGKSIFSDPDAVTDLYKTDEEYAKINRVWAPQFIWDETAFDGRGGYLVYYSVLSTNEGDTHDRIVYSYADKDFKTLTQPRIFHDPGYAVIDGDIVYNEYDGLYHFWLKHENASGNDRGPYQLVSPALTGKEWKETFHITNEGSELAEGSTTVRRIDEDDWNIYYMRYTNGSAYKVCDTDHEGMNVSGSMNVEGDGKFQHGSVITLTETEYKMLEAWDKLLSLLDEARGSGSPIFADAIANAEKALELKSVAELADALPLAIETLKEAHTLYVKNLAETNEEGEITSLIINPDFKSNSGDGWHGTPFTATSAGVAEQWNKTFDTYQDLEGMPAGTYILSCSGFYRNGGKEAYNLHVDGAENLLAYLYAGEAEKPFMSLYDSSADYKGTPSYTYPDNVTQANTAFNSKKYYADNKVSYIMKEPGTLRIGVRKNIFKDSDWTCFDNFCLFYSTDLTDVNSIYTDEENIDVISITGLVVKHNVKRSDALIGLAPGVYIAGGRKVIVR